MYIYYVYLFVYNKRIKLVLISKERPNSHCYYPRIFRIIYHYCCIPKHPNLAQCWYKF